MPTRRSKKRTTKKKAGKKLLGVEMKDVLMAQKALRAINHPIRRKIITLVQKYQPVTVTRLFTLLKLDQSFVSQYLMILRLERYVYSKKVGRQMFYFVNGARFRQVAKLVKRFR